MSTESSKPTVGLVHSPTFRMYLQDYLKMEKELPNNKVSREDTAEVIAHKLGVQQALQYIRDHYLVR